MFVEMEGRLMWLSYPCSCGRPVSLEAISAKHPAHVSLIRSVKFITVNEETYVAALQPFQSLSYEKLLKTGEKRDRDKNDLEAEGNIRK